MSVGLTTATATSYLAELHSVARPWATGRRAERFGWFESLARYKMAVRAGNMLYVSGHGPVKITPQTPVNGRCGADLTVEQGKEFVVLSFHCLKSQKKKIAFGRV